MKTADIIKNAIGSGEGGAVASKELQVIAGITERELRKSIETLRRQGCVILSGQNGYYYPETLGELRQHIKKESRRARSIFYTLRSAKELERLMQEGDAN